MRITMAPFEFLEVIGVFCDYLGVENLCHAFIMPSTKRNSITFFSSLDPQPDPNTRYEAFSRFVTTNGYVLKQLFLSDLGVIFVIFDIFALGAYLTRSRAG